MIDFDTSYLLKLYLDEHRSEDVRRLAATADRLACAWRGQAEMITHRKSPERTIDGPQLAPLSDRLLTDHGPDEDWPRKGRRKQQRAKRCWQAAQEPEPTADNG